MFILSTAVQSILVIVHDTKLRHTKNVPSTIDEQMWVEDARHLGKPAMLHLIQV